MSYNLSLLFEVSINAPKEGNNKKISKHGGLNIWIYYLFGHDCAWTNNMLFHVDLVDTV